MPKVEAHQQLELDFTTKQNVELINKVVEFATYINQTLDDKKDNTEVERPLYSDKPLFTLNTEQTKVKACKYRAIAQLQKTYIIAEDEEGGFVLVDQHAAYERINYEKYQRLLNEEIKVQEPLIPNVIQLSSSDYMEFETKLHLLESIGLRFEPFGKNAFKVVQVPSWINEVNEKEYIDELVEQVLHKNNLDVQMLRTDVIATISCKASIKAHDYLNIVEMQYVLDRLFECENPSCCPQGRPTMIAFNKYQLEKLFKRTGV